MDHNMTYRSHILDLEYRTYVIGSRDTSSMQEFPTCDDKKKPSHCEGNVLVIPPCKSFGDTFAIIGLLHFLREYYARVFLFFHSENESPVMEYFQDYFKFDPGFSQDMYVIGQDEGLRMLEEHEFDTFHMCCLLTLDWDAGDNKYALHNHPKIDRRHYFCDRNPLYNGLAIDEALLTKPNITLPISSSALEINHQVYYKLIGLNNRVRMDRFHYVRNKRCEEATKRQVLERFGIRNDDKYNVVNILGDMKPIQNRIQNEFPCINLHHLTPCTGWALSIVEGAAEIHLQESLNTNFIYHCQYRGIIDIGATPVFFHVWSRYADRLNVEYGLDYFWKMMDTPRLENWTFLFE